MKLNDSEVERALIDIGLIIDLFSVPKSMTLYHVHYILISLEKISNIFVVFLYFYENRIIFMSVHEEGSL